MLKTLYEENFLDIEKLLLQEYKNINLDLQELMILLFLFQSYKNKTFSSLNLAKKTNLSKNDVEAILERLIKKNFFSLSQEKKNNIIFEIFNLDNTFSKLEEFFLTKEKKNQEKQKNHQIIETIENLEKLKGQFLISYELEMVKSWYLEKKFSHEEIIQTIDNAHSNHKKSLHYIERMLNYENHIKIEHDEKTEQILHEIFKKMK
ncbi:DnaD domain protein [Candidatus Phytoplasma phoenicium]|uniref:Chromosome replication initiator protein n=1 Tax=Candidatus Phytoplasma phoenicium TaxID=198422 RepID=A0A0L0MJP0_9MOLU|nr:DnaD domain protein [Candidatus Phytoplasma phoenicium]KND62515.1 Chromosome replication initiator protein [Candidatus Phytoplasma phoenicium]